MIVRRAREDPTSHREVRQQMQGNVLESYSRSFVFAAYLCLHIPENKQRAAKAWLGANLESVTTAEDKPRSPTTLNIGFSYRGMRAIGIDPKALSWCSEAFKAGMTNRRDELGDTDDAWQAGGAHRSDIFVALRAKDFGALEAELERVRDEAIAADLQPVGGVEWGKLIIDPDVIGGTREPFGFADGISQPDVQTPERDRRRDALRLGEFILGFASETDRGMLYGPSQLWFGGTYLVYRKLEQDVDRFHRWREDLAARGLDEDQLSKLLVGRNMKGEAPGDVGGPAAPLTFRGDPDGRVCPIGAHVRRANPEDSLDRHRKRTRIHRMIRRGVPYTYPDDPDPEGDRRRGLLFMAFCAHPERQFEFVNRHWLNDPRAFGLDDQPDIFSHATGRFINGKPKLVVEFPSIDVERFVTVRDGEYFFMPGPRAIAGIARGDFD